MQASKKENGAFKTCPQLVSFPFSPHPSLLPSLIITQVKVKVKTSEVIQSGDFGTLNFPSVTVITLPVSSSFALNENVP